MKKSNLTILLLPTLLLAACGPTGGSGSSGGGNKVIITVDGGGDISNFNTTPSMTPSPANPYPYNTLETLCKEWEKTHPGYEVKVSKTSAGGDRSILLPQLKTRTSADIVYQNGSVVNTDLGQDFYVNLTPYLDAPNPYLEGNAAWKTVYDEGELATTAAADGNYYYINLEKIPVAFMYNKALLKDAGVTNPETIQTFSQLMDAMTKVDEYVATKDATYATYSTEYTWYQIALESNLFSDMIDEGDYLRKNNIIDTEELCRLYDKGIWDPRAGITDYSNPESNTFENNRYYEYIKIIEELDSHKAPASYATRQGWLLGKLGFIEATGAHLRALSAQTDFEWGTIAFPDLDSDTTSNAEKGVVRGSAGLASSWWVSNHAIDGGQEKVDACVDLLMFLTAPEQNNRLIGDLKGGIPLNPTDDVELASYLEPLIDTYYKDIVEAQNGNRVYWGALHSWSVLGITYSNLFIRTMQDMDAGVTTAEKAACTLAKSINSTVQALKIEYEYDTSKW